MPVNDEFVTGIDSFIKEIKIKEEERVRYMTYAMKQMRLYDYLKIHVKDVFEYPL